MRYSHRERAGLGLTECLIAIFTLALGLLGILSLFPLAAVNMATAIKDENCAQVNQSCTAWWRTFWKDETPFPQNLYPPNPPYGPGPPLVPVPHSYYDPFFNAMSDPNYAYNPDLFLTVNPLSALPALPPNYSLPSYPVFIDPVGWNNSYNLGTPQRFWVGGNDVNIQASNYLTIPRRSLRKFEYSRTPPIGAGPVGLYQTPMPPAALTILVNRFCFRLDDIGFGKDGTPYNATGDPLQTSGSLGVPLNGEVQRDGRYSCGYMLKRSQTNLPREADLTIVVYNGRNVDSPSDETAYSATFVQNSTEALITYSGSRPKIRRGNWILDATMVRPTGGIPPLMPEPHGNFYRIINVNDDTPGQLILELQVPARQGTLLPTGQSYGLGIVMEGVVEVFERATLTEFTMPVP